MSAFFSRRKSSHTAQASGQWVRIETCPLAKTGHLWTVLCQELRFFFKKVTASAMGCRSIAASYNMEYLESLAHASADRFRVKSRRLAIDKEYRSVWAQQDERAFLSADVF